MTVSGAYGRDYRSAKAALADWEAGKDFVIRDMMHAGSYVNRADAERDPNIIWVQIRFDRDRSVTCWENKLRGRSK